MRAAWLVLLAGCFDPKPAAHLACELPDHWCPPPQTCGANGFCNGGDTMPPVDAGLPEGNLVFVTSETIIPGTQMNPAIIAAADAECQMLGPRLRDGTYVAWLGATPAEAKARITATTGWARPDGLPVAYSLDELFAGNVYYPPRIDDNKRDAPAQRDLTYVGTQLPVPPDSCGTTNTQLRYGVPDGDINTWRERGDVRACLDEFWLYCFEVDRTAQIARPVLDSSMLYAFVTANAYPIGSSIDDLDADCQSEAGALAPRVFKAFVAPSNKTPKSRFGGSTKAWTRMDGVEVAPADLSQLIAPISVTAADAQLQVLVASGAPDLDQNAGSNCLNWTSTSMTEDATQGDSTHSDKQAFEGRGGTCDMPQHFYCLEAP